VIASQPAISAGLLPYIAHHQTADRHFKRQAKIGMVPSLVHHLFLSGEPGGRHEQQVTVF
jgi:hypothetical protein